MKRPEWPTEYKRAKRWQQGPKVSHEILEQLADRLIEDFCVDKEKGLWLWGVILPWKPIQIIDALASVGVTLEGSIKKCDISHRSAVPETRRFKATAGR